MISREQVIKGLECITQRQEPTANSCKECGYINRPNFAICVKDIASDALELLKEEKPVKPVVNVDEWVCGCCGTWLERQRMIHPGAILHDLCEYCPACGKKVDWEAVKQND